MPKPKRAPRAPVIYLAAFRKARSAPPVVRVEDADPYDVLECMINAYFSAMSTQLEKLKSTKG